MNKTEKLPCGGRLVRSPQRRFSTTIVFIHQFGGNRSSMIRHQHFVAQLGFDSVAFNLTFDQHPPWARLPVINKLQFGLRQTWQEEICSILSAIDGEKILYSFSYPSASAVQSIPSRPTGEILGWICDGGPFLHLPQCLWNYFTYHEPTPNLLLKAAKIAIGFNSMGGLTLAGDLQAALDGLPKNFPILSIRSWQDRLVPISAIDAVFDGHSQIHLETLTLPEAGHIDGLATFPQEYGPRVEKFLQQLAKPVAASSEPSAPRSEA